MEFTKQTFASHFLVLAAICSAFWAGCERKTPSAAEFVAQGVQHARDGKYRAALVKFSTALQVDPSYDLAYLYMASLFEDYLDDRSNAVATLQAYRAAANTEFSLRIATRLLYAAELEKLEQERQRLQAIATSPRAEENIHRTSASDGINSELLLARERIAMLEAQLASATSRVLPSVTFASPAVVTVQVARTDDHSDFALTLRRLNETEDALRRQTALVLHLEQRLMQLQQLLNAEMQMRAELERALPTALTTVLTSRTVVPPSTSVSGSDEIVHVVQPGDTLTALARRYYGTPDLWMRIYLRNRSTLPTPDTLRQGQVLFIPR